MSLSPPGGCSSLLPCGTTAPPNCSVPAAVPPPPRHCRSACCLWSPHPCRSGLSAVIFHARPAADRYGAGAGHDGWGRIATLEADLTIPVVSNGDVITAADAGAMDASKGAAEVATKRGALGRPWLFEDLAAAWAAAAAAMGVEAGTAAAAAACGRGGSGTGGTRRAASPRGGGCRRRMRPASAGGAAAEAAVAVEARAVRTLHR